MNSDFENVEKFEAGDFNPSLQNTVMKVKKLKEARTKNKRISK